MTTALGHTLPRVALGAIGTSHSVDFAISLTNRDPFDGATGVSVDTVVSFEIQTTFADLGIDLSQTQVWLDGELAYDGALGGFQPLFSGAESAVSETTSIGALSPDGVAFSVDRIASFDSLAEISVRVVAVVSGNPLAIDETWSFSVEDTTALLVGGARAERNDSVFVVFSKAVPDEWLTPSAFSISGISDGVIGFVEVVVVSVERIDDETIRLFLDWEMSPYPVTYSVSAVIGEYDAGFAVFDGWVSPAPAGYRDFDLWSMLPQINRREDATEDLHRVVSCMQDAVSILLYDIDRWSDIIDLDIAGEDFIDAMIADMGVPPEFYAMELSLNKKRKVLRVIVDIYATKGTREGIRSALRFILAIDNVAIQDFGYEGGWKLGDGELGEDTYLGPGVLRGLYSFNVLVDRTLTPDELLKLEGIVDYMKPAHTHHIDTLEF